MKTFAKILVAVWTLVLFQGTATMQHARAAAIDVLVVVDESGSMNTEHGWLPGVINDLDVALNAVGITGNYGLVGFGANFSSPGSPRTLTDFTTASAFGTAAGSLVLNGATEDGYDGIDYGFNNLTFGTNGATATNVILVTDEDRDVANGSLNYANMLTALTDRGALLNAVVNASFTSDGGSAIGIDSSGEAYLADGSGGFTTSTGGTTVSAAGTTLADYINLAVASGGAAWDLNQLRAGGNAAESFSNAFIDIKVQEIQEQVVPEPGMVAIFATGLFALHRVRRRRA